MVILNYNGRGILDRFLPALARTDYQPLELVVVDNASADDSVAWLRANWPQVTILSQPLNRYWAGGNNAGIRYALEKGYRYIVFANNDIEPHPCWVREAVQLAEAQPDLGFIGFRLFNQEPTRPAFEAASRQWSQREWRAVEHVDGCSLFCRADVFRAIGPFDEDYLIYAEESDWECRALLAGWRAAELNVPVWHFGEATMRRVALRRGYLQMRNVIRLQLKLHGAAAALGMTRTVLNRACNPWLRLDTDADYLLKRYRPASPPVNAALALAAIGWNLWKLPQTLRAGRRDRGLIEASRAQRST
jgi:GT2 family glycosyltransferase